MPHFGSELVALHRPAFFASAAIGLPHPFEPPPGDPPPFLASRE
jgi:hypothetical protein